VKPSDEQRGCDEYLRPARVRTVDETCGVRLDFWSQDAAHVNRHSVIGDQRPSERGRDGRREAHTGSALNVDGTPPHPLS